MDWNKFTLLRNAVVAIGLADRDDLSPLIYNGKTMIEGTGFLVGSNGYLMTAPHVLDSCMHNKQRISGDPKIGFFQVTVNEGLEVSFKFCEITKALEIGSDINNALYPGPRQLDLVIGMSRCKPVAAHLEIKKPDKMNLSDEVILCGYPGTWQSIYYHKRGMYAGIRLGPVTQTGKIGVSSTKCPLNECPKPYALQTDIVTTRGYSGSPIVDVNDGKVIAIAQQVIWSDADVVTHDVVGNYLEGSLPHHA